MRINLFVFTILAINISKIGLADGALEPSEITANVYVTAKDTGQRLANAGELSFQNLPQPAEGQEMIFVDPAKNFSDGLGIGGALTDASAETFYKLPKDKQREILTGLL